MEKPRQKSLPLIIEQIRSAYYHNDSNIDELLDELKDTMPESGQPKNLKFEKLLKNLTQGIKRNPSEPSPQKSNRNKRGKHAHKQTIQEPQPSTSKQITKTTTSFPLEKFPCKICSKVLNTNFEYNRHHMAKHSKKQQQTEPTSPQSSKPYACDICEATYQSKESLRKHVKDQHSNPTSPEPQKPERPIENPTKKCYICIPHIKFNKPFGLLTHNATVHRNQEHFPCPQCSRIFKRNACLTSHVQVKHNGREKGGPVDRSCYVCHLDFKTIDQYKRHLKQIDHNELTNVTCTTCNTVSNSHTNHRRHASRKHSDKPPDELASEQYSNQPETQYILTEPTPEFLRSAPATPNKTTKTTEQEEPTFEQITHTTLPIHPGAPPMEILEPTHDPTPPEQPEQEITEIATINPTKQQQKNICQFCKTPQLTLKHLEHHLTSYHNLPPDSISHFLKQDTNDQNTDPLPTNNNKQISLPNSNQNYQTYPPNMPQPVKCDLCTDHSSTTNYPNRNRLYNNKTLLHIHLLEQHQSTFASDTILAQIADPYVKANGPLRQTVQIEFEKVDLLKSEPNLKCPCKLCKENLKNPKAYLKHLKSEHYDFLKPYRTAVSNHQQTKLYKCADCNAAYHDINHLTTHITTHKTKWELKCRNCLHTIPNNKQDDPCHKCKKPSSYFDENPTSNLYECRLCDKTSHDDLMLQLHMAYNHRKQWEVILKNAKMLETLSPFKCTQCTNDTSIDPMQQENHLINCSYSKHTK